LKQSWRQRGYLQQLVLVLVLLWRRQ